MDILEKNVYNGNLTYIDLDSFYKYFLIQEFFEDIDSVLSSFHLTKRKGDDKLYFGLFGIMIALLIMMKD